ncbi:MAG: Gfo/Idh/MocA family protein [Planctomycetota bacterium]|jgi:predicted dehydrogenase
MKKIKAGLIGGGFIGAIHAEMIRRLGFVDVVAIAELNQEKADEIAAELSIPTAYGDYRDLIKDRDVDVVHILTPNKFHFQMSKDAMEAGKHVICEKPLSMNSQEAFELVHTARESGVVNSICHNKRYYPLVKQAREMVKAGEAGDIRLVHGNYLQDWLFFDTDYNWRLESELGGKSRAVADIGTHWLDMVQHIIGQQVVSVYADLTIFHPIRKKPKVESATYIVQELKPEDYNDVKIDTEDHGTLMLKFSGGAKGMLIACQVCAGRKNHIEWEINGTKRSLQWCGEKPNYMWIGERGKANAEFIKNPAIMYPDAGKYAGAPCGLGEGYLDTFKSIFSDVYGWIRKGKSMDEKSVPFPTFLTGLCELSIVDAVLKSAETDKWVDVNYQEKGGY